MDIAQNRENMVQSNNKHPRRGFIQVREEHTNWLLFLYDPDRQLIEIQRRGHKTIVDLTQYQRV